jgi:hypothetical protein
MRAILVCVDYSDYLAVTLPYNINHFSDVLVVTSERDVKTSELCRSFMERGLPVDCLQTDVFYADGADFNKFRAMEQGLDVMGRNGWICVMDADVLWPRQAPLTFRFGTLTTPLRRMMDPFSGVVPPEERWVDFPVHRNVGEWAGYSQIFHADDPALGPAPWHQTDWRHAGGGDTFFQLKWPTEAKLRTGWEVLHLGQAGRNWCGRVTTLLDGTRPAESDQRSASLQEYMRVRRERGNSYDHERL